MLSDAAIKLLGISSGVIMAVAKRLAMRKYALVCRSFIPRPDDIFVVTFPRSGTTLTQMILYQILTDGEIDFEHINEWSPHFEDRISQRQNVEHLPSPRVLKSHLDYQSIPKGACKYIYVVRNGKDTAISYFHYSRTHMGFTKDFGTFFENFLNGKYNYGSWFEHVGQWWENRHNLNVLFLTYEELTSKREGAIRKIIDFCGLEVGPEKFSRIMERSSFAFMKQHEDKFDTLTWQFRELNLKTGSFIRKAQIGEWKECLSSEQEELFRHSFTKRLDKLSADLKDIIR
jgi:hypothetical protein